MIEKVLSGVIRSVISGVIGGGGSGFPDGRFDTVNTPYFPEPIGGSTATQRDQTNLDGQDDFWLAGFVWSTASASSGFAYSIVGSDDANTSINDDLGTDGSGNIIWSSFAGETATLNGNVITSGTTQFVVGEINSITIIGTYSGSIDRHGTNLAGTQFYPAAISALMLIDGASSANSYVYKLTGNAPYENAIGEELGENLAIPAFELTTAFNGGVFTADGAETTFENVASFAGFVMIDEDMATVEDVYLVSFEITEVAGPVVARVAFTGAAVVDFAAEVGVYQLLVPSVANAVANCIFTLLTGIAGISVKFKNTSIELLPKSTLTFENGEPDGSDRELITRKSDNSGWTAEDSWGGVKTVMGNATAPTANSITINELTTTLAGVSVEAPDGALVLVTGVLDLTSGEVDISPQTSLNGVSTTLTTSGPFSVVITSEGGVGFKRSFSEGAIASITDIKAVPFYDFAAGAND